MDLAYSIDGIPIRLTAERWFYMEQSLVSEQDTLGTTASILHALPYLIRFPSRRFWVDYDEEADVLYISFRRPQKATDSEMSDKGILLRYRGKELVGITVLDVSTRSEV